MAACSVNDLAAIGLGVSALLSAGFKEIQIVFAQPRFSVAALLAGGVSIETLILVGFASSTTTTTDSKTK